MTRIKICGITRKEDACLAVELGASALGFNFYSQSPRCITPQTACGIIAGLPPFVCAVGVFADQPDPARVLATAEQARVTAIQLHGPRFPASFEPLHPFPVIRAVPVTQAFNPETLLPEDTAALLLDAFDPERIGGSGKTIDWALASKSKTAGKPVILAGGLTPENVAEAIGIVKPYAVDVATGVESSPGAKDPAKLRAFFAAVYHADEQFYLRPELDEPMSK